MSTFFIKRAIALRSVLFATPLRYSLRVIVVSLMGERVRLSVARTRNNAVVRMLLCYLLVRYLRVEHVNQELLRHRVG
jgi:hypothetical protein